MRRLFARLFLVLPTLIGGAGFAYSTGLSTDSPERPAQFRMIPETGLNVAQAGNNDGPNFGICIDLKTGERGHCGETNDQARHPKRPINPARQPTRQNRIIVIRSGCSPEMRRVMAGLPCKEQSICIDTATGRRWDCTGHEPGKRTSTQHTPGKDGKRPLPPFVKKAAGQYEIILFLPETAHLKALRKRIFGPSTAPFRMAEITGRVLWKGQGRKGAATRVPVKGIVSRDLRFLRKEETRTDSRGYFQLKLLVNPKGFIPRRRFSITVWRSLKNGIILPPPRTSRPSNTGPASAGRTWSSKYSRRYWGEPAKGKPDVSARQNSHKNSGGFSRPSWRKHYVVNPRYAKIWNGVSWLWVKIKDAFHHALGGKGNPNQKRWERNHAAGRDFANAFDVVKDFASGGVGKGVKGVDVAQKVIKGVDVVSKYKNKKVRRNEKGSTKNKRSSWVIYIKNISDRLRENARATDEYHQ